MDGGDQIPEAEAISEIQKTVCKQDVLLLFPDICPQYLDELGQTHSYSSEPIIAAILDQQERDVSYPRRRNPRKRKRGRDNDDDDDDDDNDPIEDTSVVIEAKLDEPQYLARMHSSKYKEMATTLISQDFPLVPKTTIKGKLLAENGSSAFRTYIAIDDIIRNGQDANTSWLNKKTPTKIMPKYTAANIGHLKLDELATDERAALNEFLAARKIKADKDAAEAAKAVEASNLEEARKSGQTAECGVCFDDFALNRMVQCEGNTIHLFCRGCMRQQAETRIGYSKHELTCMSMDECSAGFSSNQRRLFLDKKLQVALDRIEAQAMLEAAGIENLETCPFCPMAMEYPSVQENKEFRCPNPECEITSCRLCRKKTHIPKTCAEAALEEGHSARHTIEEAMSDAVIRKCNKCSNPYIKSDGCNKIYCTRCRTIQCYICRQTVKDYTHFNDSGRGGKPGQCPLFDSTEERHQNEVKNAEEKTRKQVAENNPELNDSILSFKMSANVEADERKRKEQEVRPRQRAYAPIPAPPLPLFAGRANAGQNVDRLGHLDELQAMLGRGMEAVRQAGERLMQPVGAVQAGEHLQQFAEVQARNEELVEHQRVLAGIQQQLAERNRLQVELVQNLQRQAIRVPEPGPEHRQLVQSPQTRASNGTVQPRAVQPHQLPKAEPARLQEQVRRTQHRGLRLQGINAHANLPPLPIALPPPPSRHSQKGGDSGQDLGNPIVLDGASPQPPTPAHRQIRNDNVFVPLLMGGADLAALRRMRSQSLQDLIDNTRVHQHLMGAGAIGVDAHLNRALDERRPLHEGNLAEGILQANNERLNRLADNIRQLQQQQHNLPRGPVFQNFARADQLQGVRGPGPARGVQAHAAPAPANRVRDARA